MKTPFLNLLRAIGPALLVFLLVLMGITLDLKRFPPAKSFSWTQLKNLESWTQPVTWAKPETRPVNEITNGVEAPPWRVNALFCLPDSLRCWAAADNGTILTTQNGGKNWWIQTSKVQTHLLSVYFINNEFGWIAGENGTILTTQDGGKNWQPQNSKTDVQLLSVHFASDKLGWAAGGNGTVLITQDGGQNWQQQNSETHARLLSIYFVNDKLGWTTADNGSVLTTSNGGQNWQMQNSETRIFLTSTYFLNKTVGWAISESGAIYATQDGGKNWKIQNNIPHLAHLTSVYFLDEKVGWAIGKDGAILATQDGGQSWLPQNSKTRAHLLTIHFIDNNVGWTAGQNGAILNTQDGGKSWHIQNKDTQTNFNSAYFFKDKFGWIAGDEGSIWSTQDGGKSWFPQASQTMANLSSLTFVNNQMGWVAGANGTILTTNNGGKDWQAQFHDNRESFQSIFFHNEKIGWALGNNSFTNTIWGTQDSGNSWQKLHIFSNDTSLNAIHFINKDTGWAAGSDGRVLITHNGGISWNRQRPAKKQNIEDLVALNDIYFTDTKTGWAVGWYGTIWTTQNGGKTWLLQNSTTEKTLNSIHFISDKLGWTAGSGGTILVTQDGGKTWLPQNSETEKNLNSIHFISDKIGWAAGSDGILLNTLDGGKTWVKSLERNLAFLTQRRDARFGPYHQWPSPYLWALTLLSLVWLSKRMLVVSRNPREYLSDQRGGVCDAALSHPDEDKLGYSRLARAIAKLVRNLDSKPPFALAVTAQWGSGKSSVMNMVRHELAIDAHTVLFNVWHYRNDDQILAALVEHIREQAIPKGLTLGNLVFRYRLLWRRVLQPNWYWWAVVLPVLLAATAYTDSGVLWQQAASAAQSVDAPFLKWAEEIPSWLKLLLVPLVAWFTLPKLYSKLLGPFAGFSAQLTEAAGKIAKASDVADWSKDAGLRFRFQQDFADICHAFGSNRPLVLVIDDMDRCEPKQLEAIITTLNFLFANDTPCYVVMALDWIYVTKALGLAYKDIAQEVHGDNLANTRMAFADNYLRKIIQLKVELPDVEVVNNMAEEEKHAPPFPVAACLQRIVETSACWLIDSLIDITLLLWKGMVGLHKIVTEWKQWRVQLGNWHARLDFSEARKLLAWFCLTPYRRFKRQGEQDLANIGNLLFLIASSWIIALLLFALLKTITLTTPELASPAPVATSTPATAQPKQQEELLRTKPDASNKQNKLIVVPPQPNQIEQWYNFVPLLFAALFSFWMIWLATRERDSAAFQQALKVWRKYLNDTIKTPREWCRLENTFRFFMMLARSQHSLTERFEQKFQELATWSESGQWPKPKYPAFDEGLATHLLMADLLWKGEVSNLLNQWKGDDFEQQIKQSVFYTELVELVAAQSAQPQKTLTDFMAFIERIACKDYSLRDDEFLQLWLSLSDYKLQQALYTKVEKENKPAVVRKKRHFGARNKGNMST